MELQTNINNGSPHFVSSNASNPQNGDMLVDEKDFLSFITIKQALAYQSIRHTRIRIRHINKWFVDNELTKENVEKFLLAQKERGLSNASLNTYLFVFRQLKAYCQDKGLDSSFLDGFSSFKKKRADIVIFTFEEIDKLINAKIPPRKYQGKDCSFLDFKYSTLTMFLAFTGARFSEAANLKIKNLDISAGKATFIDTKTNENRTVYFNEPLVGRLKKIIEGRGLDDYVFVNIAKHRLNPQDYSSDLKRRARIAGITKRVFPHNFRHSYITHLLEAGVPITEVASLVGHKDIQTTYSTYMHLADQTLRKAAMRHPMVRKNIEPNEIIRIVKETIENLHLETDIRFDYSLFQEQNKLNLKLSLK